jgi:tetratricopeptide (TPR) repeat protein
MSRLPSIAALERQIRHDQNRGDPAAEARARAQLGQVLLSRQQTKLARGHYQRAVELFSRCGQDLEAARAANHLAACLIMEDRPEDALAVLEPLTAGLNRRDYPRLWAAVTGNLGLAQAKINDYTKAVACHKQVLEQAEQRGDQDLQLQAQIHLAECYLQEGRLRQAQGFALVARDLARRLDRLPKQAVIHDLLGMISARRGDHRGALREYRRSGKLAAEVGDLHQQALALANQALSREALTELEAARELMDQARELFMGLGSPHLEKIDRDLDRIRLSLRSGPDDQD